MLRYIRNGQATLAGATYWRVDDLEAMNAPDYDPISFLRTPAILISQQLAPKLEDVDAIVKVMNDGARWRRALTEISEWNDGHNTSSDWTGVIVRVAKVALEGSDA